MTGVLGSNLPAMVAGEVEEGCKLLSPRSRVSGVLLKTIERFGLGAVNEDVCEIGEAVRSMAMASGCGVISPSSIAGIRLAPET